MLGCEWEVDALHGVLPALDARSWLRGRCDVLDYLPDLLLQLADFLDLRVIDGSDEDQAYGKARVSELAARWCGRHDTYRLGGRSEW